VFAIGLWTLVIAALTAWGVTPWLIRLAHVLGAVDHPDPRKVHQAPMPRIGGVAVFAGVVSGLLFANWAGGTYSPELAHHATVLAITTSAMFLLGLLDDIRGVGFGWKFTAQVAAAMIAWTGGFRIDMISLPLSSHVYTLELLSLPITVLWIVGITNAVNLIDGLDGLAAGTALITTVAVAASAAFRGHLGVLAVSVALVGSLLGFLRWNFRPARIFLGDSGSLFLGFLLAVISIRGSQKGTTVVAVLAPVLLLALPIADTSLAVLRRSFGLLAAGKRSPEGMRHVARNLTVVFRPDQGHIHHQLVARGLGHRQVVLVLYAVVCLCALVALGDVWVNSPVLGRLLAGALVVTSVLFLGGVYLGRRRRVRRSRISATPHVASAVARAADAEVR
jgi:UDP-GlcNAc:undecaprenyl-phosphate GlcNAc-1-phosphate transferase